MNKNIYINNMESYKFSDIRLDSNIKIYHYLPYLDYINKSLVDEYNKFILKRRFGYYQDINNPNIFLEKRNRYINDQDMLNNYKNNFEEINNLINSLYYEFDIAYEKVNYYKRKEYSLYKKMVISNLNQESIRLNNIIEMLDNYKVDNRSKKYKIIHLISIVFTLFVIMLLSFNYYKNK